MEFLGRREIFSGEKRAARESLINMRMKPAEKGMTKARSEHGIINFVSQKSSAFVSADRPTVELFFALAALFPSPV
jgi:hypothetical protein